MAVRHRYSNVDVVHNAFAFAMHAHQGQTRKYTSDPYIIHPIRVADILRGINARPEMVAAAFLHDVLEDTDAKIYELREVFGNEITDLVIELTDVYVHPHMGNRATRKRLERQRLAGASADAQTIKVADLIDNGISIEAHDPDFAKVYLVEKAALLEVMTKADPRLVAHAWISWSVNNPAR